MFLLFCTFAVCSDFHRFSIFCTVLWFSQIFNILQCAVMPLSPSVDDSLALYPPHAPHIFPPYLWSYLNIFNMARTYLKDILITSWYLVKFNLILWFILIFPISFLLSENLIIKATFEEQRDRGLCHSNFYTVGLLWTNILPSASHSWNCDC